MVVGVAGIEGMIGIVALAAVVIGIGWCYCCHYWGWERVGDLNQRVHFRPNAVGAGAVVDVGWGQ